jgi:hypothetical protein
MISETIVEPHDRAENDQFPHEHLHLLPPQVRQALEFPRLRENIWHIAEDEPLAYVETLTGVFEVPTSQAVSFLKVRSHCTGLNSIAEIAARSGVCAADIRSMVLNLFAADLLLPSLDSPPQPEDSLDSIRLKLRSIGEVWGKELTRDYVANKLLTDNLPKEVLVGWLLEMYHYVRDFPEAIEHGAQAAAGPLRKLFLRYASEERGHEEFVLRALVNLGLKRSEVEASTPLVSTRLVGLLMRELFELEPATVLLVAAIIEAHEIPEAQLNGFQRQLESRYDLPKDTLGPYFEHQFIDVALGHSKLLEDNMDLFSVRDPKLLDAVVNKIHDLKHAFELQSQEIQSYYGNLGGMYLPRQPLTFSSL